MQGRVPQAPHRLQGGLLLFTYVTSPFDRSSAEPNGVCCAGLRGKDQGRRVWRGTLHGTVLRLLALRRQMRECPW
jgi:hypothetical protein